MGKRILTFFLGFLFGIIVLVGGVAGVGYWAYKNLDIATLEKWGWIDSSAVLEDDSDLKGLSVEGWIKEMTNLANGAENTSLDALVTQYKIKLPADVRKYIPDAAMTIPLKNLFGADGLDHILTETDLNYVLQFLPDGAMSPYLRNALGSKTLKAVTSGDISALTEGLYVGYLLSGIEFETDAEGNVVFTDATVGSGADAHTVRRPVVVHKEGGDAAMETLAALEVKRLYDGLTDASGVGLLGVLAEDIGDKELTELLPVDTSDALMDTLLGGRKIGDLFVRSADTGKYTFSADALTADVYVGALMGYERGAQKTNADGSLVTDAQGNPKYDWTTEKNDTVAAVTGIEDSFANVRLQDLTDGSFSVENTVEGLYIGEVMGYVKGDAKSSADTKYDWYAKSDGGARGAQVTGIEEAIANVTLSEMLSGGFSVEDTFAGMYVGELMKYEQGAEIVSSDPNAAKKYEWYVKNADGTRGSRVERMEEAVANILMTDLIGGNFEITDSFDGMYVGEIMKYVKGEAKPATDPAAAVKYDWYAKNADGTRGAQITGVDEAIANIPMSDLLGGSFDATEAFDGMFVGEVMGYTKDGVKDGAADEYYWKNGETRVGALNGAIANIRMSELLDGTFDASGMIDKLTLGDVLGYTQTGGAWTDADGNAVTGILGALAGKTVKEIPDAINAISVGEVMNMKLIDGVWYTADADGNYTAPATGIMKALADLTVADLQDSDKLTQKIQNDLTLADALGYTEQNGEWLDGNGNPVTGIMSALAGKKVGELAGAVNETELGVVLGYKKIGGVWYTTDASGSYTVPATGVIKALADTKIDGLDSALQNMEIGKIMGLEFRAPTDDPQSTAVWCKEESDGAGGTKWVAADSLTVKFASKKLNELNGDIFKEIVDGLTVNEIFTGERTGILTLMAPDADPKITELPTVLADSVTNAKMADLLSVGIVTDSMAQTVSAISSKVYRTSSDPANEWKARTMAEFFADVNALLEKIPV